MKADSIEFANGRGEGEGAISDGSKFLAWLVV